MLEINKKGKLIYGIFPYYCNYSNKNIFKKEG